MYNRKSSVFTLALCTKKVIPVHLLLCILLHEFFFLKKIMKGLCHRNEWELGAKINQ